MLCQPQMSDMTIADPRDSYNPHAEDFPAKKNKSWLENDN